VHKLFVQEKHGKGNDDSVRYFEQVQLYAFLTLYTVPFFTTVTMYSK